MISMKLLAGLLSYCIHTSLRGCGCAVGIVITMSGRAYVHRVSFPDDISETVSRIAYTNPLGGVDVPFGGDDL